MSVRPVDRLAAALRCEQPDRVPWVPFVGCHAAALLEMPADEYLRSADNVVGGVQAAIDRYRPDGIPVMFDLQVEAEALGCALNWAKDNPPAVTGHPLEEGVALGELTVPDASAGRIGLAFDAARRLREANADVALYGLLTGPFTLALHLMGTQIFMAMFDEPERVEAVLAFCRRVGERMVDGYVEAGCDVIAVVDPMTSQIGPEQFRRYVTPEAAPLFERIGTADRFSSFFVCGHAQQNIQAMCECGPDNVSVDENIPLEYVRDVCLPRGISFGGNMQLTTVLLMGSEADAQRSALDCLDTGGKTGFVLAPGCDLPYATPPANLVAVSELIADPYRREVAETLSRDACDSPGLDMSDYGQAEKVIVDVITLDSEACAPCQYMVEAVQAVCPEFEGVVEWREHKIKQPESVVFMTSLMVRNVPTICIDGKITFVSRIPRREELIAAVQKRIYEKLRQKIQRRRATVYVLGDGGDEYARALASVRRAVTELGNGVEIVEVLEPARQFTFGVSPAQTPAVVISRYQVKCTNKVPEAVIVKEWIKDVL